MHIILILTRLLYNTIIYLGLPILLIRLILRSRHYPAYRHRLTERLGYNRFYAYANNHRLSKPIWLHAVSLGESIAAMPLIKQIMAKYPNTPLLVTNMTPTGSAYIRQQFNSKQVYNCYLPYDVPHLMRRFLKRTQPCLAIIMETELWPNMLSQCHHRKIPVLLTNARLSARSTKGYALFRQLTYQMMQQLSAVAAQSIDDGDRFIALGLTNTKLSITGNIKFDIRLPSNINQLATQWRQQFGPHRPIWIAASTHEGEEQLILQAHQLILAQHSNALLILVPRHPDRFDKVAVLLDATKLHYQRKSQLKSVQSNNMNVVLGDSMGELLTYLAASDIAFIGGSLVNTGGHNLLEPAALGKPVLSGPHVFNFQQIANQLSKANALLLVNNPNELATQIIKLFNQPDLINTMGNNGLSVVKQNTGALTRQFTLVQELLANT